VRTCRGHVVGRRRSLRRQDRARPANWPSGLARGSCWSWSARPSRW